MYFNEEDKVNEMINKIMPDPSWEFDAKAADL